MVWSEAPFISFSMAGLLLLAYHVTRPSPSLLVLASLMIGLAASTRYVGVVLFPATAFAILLLDKRSLKHRAKDILILSCLACLPLVLWLIRNMLIAHSATNREFAFHPFNLNQAKSLIISTYDFFLPIVDEGTSCWGSFYTLCGSVRVSLQEDVYQAERDVNPHLSSLDLIYLLRVVRCISFRFYFFLRCPYAC
jgi:4-amino-4-deoxy-L-arabinose transferase-like glycosyltransferase